MSIYFSTTNAAGLLKAFNDAIAGAHHGNGQRVETWRHVIYNGQNYYTHTSANWRDKAWLRAETEANRLTFVILPVERVLLTREIYAYYAGHLIETFIRHFPRTFTAAQATPNAAGSDAQF